MGLPSNWRSPKAAEDYANHDFADFAQEFLRRNPDYQADYKVVEKPPATADGAEIRDAIANKWGLVFRLPSSTFASRRSSPMASRGGARRSHPNAVTGVIGTVTFPRPSTPDINWLAVA